MFIYAPIGQITLSRPSKPTSDAYDEPIPTIAIFYTSATITLQYRFPIHSLVLISFH